MGGTSDALRWVAQATHSDGWHKRRTQITQATPSDGISDALDNRWMAQATLSDERNKRHTQTGGTSDALRRVAQATHSDNTSDALRWHKRRTKMNGTSDALR